MAGNFHADEKHISIDLLNELFVADFEKGILCWKERDVSDWRIKSWNKRFAGKIAGRITNAGHRQIVITIGSARLHTMAHRVLWAMKHGYWPIHLIDHVDGYSDDNREEKIRAASMSQNMMNRRMASNNTSGFKGVYWIKALGKWKSGVFVKKKFHCAGYFDKAIDAAKAYDKLALVHFKEFARTNAMMGLI